MIRRCCEQTADVLARVPAAGMSGEAIRSLAAGLQSLAEPIGISLDLDPIAKIIDRTLDECLRNANDVTNEAALRALDLVTACGAIGVPIRRTTLEENVYALLAHHDGAIAAKLAGRTTPNCAVDIDTLIALAEQSNLSLARWKRASAQSA